MDDPTTVIEDRTLRQFHDSPNVMALLDILADQILDSLTPAEFIANGYDLSTAAGVWLDLLGELIGVSRPGKPLEDGYIFAYCESGHSAASKGFVDGGVGGYFQSAEGLLKSPEEPLSDTDYRKMLQAKAYAVANIPTVSNIATFFETLGYEDITLDNEVGNITITLDASDPMSQYLRNWVRSYGPAIAGVDLYIANWPEVPS